MLKGDFKESAFSRLKHEKEISLLTTEIEENLRNYYK